MVVEVMQAVNKPRVRFVVLRHDKIAEPHFDLMFETAPGSALATWRFPAWPTTAPVSVTRLADHRRHYLDHEGEVSGGRGTVERIAAGMCTATSKSNGELELLLLSDQGASIRLLIRQRSANAWEAMPG